ncbi:MAG: FHA domain-containing protein, partial [Oscillospiraceae bacterium]|nr:FHA domain-containing protein [Oscillospiraceae bacterium]
PKKKGFTTWLFGERKQKNQESQQFTQPQPSVQPEYQAPPSVSPPAPQGQQQTPYVRITSGPVTVGLWDLPDNTEINVGRDSSLCSIIVSGTAISRKHCSVLYNSATMKFIVMDHSSNGTYFGNGERLASKVQYAVDPGGIIMLASPNHIMEVGLR